MTQERLTAWDRATAREDYGMSADELIAMRQRYPDSWGGVEALLLREIAALRALNRELAAALDEAVWYMEHFDSTSPSHKSQLRSFKALLSAHPELLR